jgi:hypothetical protein
MQELLALVQRLSFIFLAVPSGYPTARSICQRLMAKTWQFLSIFLEAMFLQFLF